MSDKEKRVEGVDARPGRVNQAAIWRRLSKLLAAVVLLGGAGGVVWELGAEKGKRAKGGKEEGRPLTKEEQRLFQVGEEWYAITCLACHQPHGGGQEGLAPPLLETDWVLGSPERLVRIILHGMTGPVEVKGKVWNMEMPPMGILDDEQIAGVLTYIRRQWGHEAEPISMKTVARIRSETSERSKPWKEEELLKIGGREEGEGKSEE